VAYLRDRLTAVKIAIRGVLTRTKIIAVTAGAVVGSICLSFIPRIRSINAGGDPNATSSYYAVYVTFNKYGNVADYIADQIAALSDLGYRVLVISNSKELSDQNLAKLSRDAWKVLHRRNIGWDFGAYKDGIVHIGSLNRLTSLILMNDSCYGPIGDLRRFESNARAGNAHVWGITDSWWDRYHIQSYFLRIGNLALCSNAFQRFWARQLPYQPRSLVIRNGEIRFTQVMLRAGMKTAVLCPYQAVASQALEKIITRLTARNARIPTRERQHLRTLADHIAAGSSLNPMHSFWDILITEFSCPFLKKDLLRRNPTAIPNLYRWEQVILNHTQYDVEKIKQDLQIY